MNATRPRSHSVPLDNEFTYQQIRTLLSEGDVKGAQQIFDKTVWKKVDPMQFIGYSCKTHTRMTKDYGAEAQKAIDQARRALTPSPKGRLTPEDFQRQPITPPSGKSALFAAIEE